MIQFLSLFLSRSVLLTLFLSHTILDKSAYIVMKPILVLLLCLDVLLHVLKSDGNHEPENSARHWLDWGKLGFLFSPLLALQEGLGRRKCHACVYIWKDRVSAVLVAAVVLVKQTEVKQPKFPMWTTEKLKMYLS